MWGWQKTLSAFFLCYTREVDFTAQFEKYFDRCPDCEGLGVAKNNGSNPVSCATCHGGGLSLKLPEADLLTTLPLFVNFNGRTKAFILKILLMLAAAVFIVGVPYAIFVYVVGFIANLRSL